MRHSNNNEWESGSSLKNGQLIDWTRLIEWMDKWTKSKMITSVIMGDFPERKAVRMENDKRSGQIYSTIWLRESLLYDMSDSQRKSLLLSIATFTHTHKHTCIYIVQHSTSIYAIDCFIFLTRNKQKHTANQNCFENLLEKFHSSRALIILKTSFDGDDAGRILFYKKVISKIDGYEIEMVWD